MNERDANLRDLMALVVAPRGTMRRAVLAKRIKGRVRYTRAYCRRAIAQRRGVAS